VSTAQMLVQIRDDAVWIAVRKTDANGAHVGRVGVRFVVIGEDVIGERRHGVEIARVREIVGESRPLDGFAHRRSVVSLALRVVVQVTRFS
jgi:hypothetical protein